MELQNKEMQNMKVVYHNDLNKISLRKFNAMELNVLMALCEK